MVHQRLPHGKEVIINHRSVYLNRNDRSRRNGFYHKPMVPGIREPTVAVIASHFPLSRRCYVRMYGACGEIGALISKGRMEEARYCGVEVPGVGINGPIFHPH